MSAFGTFVSLVGIAALARSGCSALIGGGKEKEPLASPSVELHNLSVVPMTDPAKNNDYFLGSFQEVENTTGVLQKLIVTVNNFTYTLEVPPGGLGGGEFNIDVSDNPLDLALSTLAVSIEKGYCSVDQNKARSGTLAETDVTTSISVKCWPNQ